VSSQASAKSTPGLIIGSPEPTSPATKTAGDVKAGLVNGINVVELADGHEPLPSPNGNLT